MTADDPRPAGEALTCVCGASVHGPDDADYTAHVIHMDRFVILGLRPAASGGATDGEREATGDGGTYAYRCGVCHGRPKWRLEREGDAVVSWACDRDLNTEMGRLQRDGERTVIRLMRSGAPWLDDLRRALDSQ